MTRLAVYSQLLSIIVIIIIIIIIVEDKDYLPQFNWSLLMNWSVAVFVL